MPRRGGFQSQIPPLHFLLSFKKKKKKFKKIRSPSQALFRDYWQSGDLSSDSGRQNCLAPARKGVSLENPGPRDFLRSVMSHPDPAGSSSCPWKTRLAAGLPAPAIPRRGLRLMGGHSLTPTPAPFIPGG